MNRENEKQFVKEFIELIERHGMILCYPGFLQGNAMLLKRGHSILGEAYESLLQTIKDSNNNWQEEEE